MKTTAYTKQERAISASDRGGIRERWRYGLRLTRDPQAIAAGGGLRHGVAEQLIAAAAKTGRKLSAREIQRRIQCARAYPTESQIRQVLADFETWWDLHSAGFPPYEVDPDEPLADHRDAAEQEYAQDKSVAEHASGQLSMFPDYKFDPFTSTLTDLRKYADEMERMTAGFAERDRKRREYLNALVAAAGGDEATTWEAAHLAAFGTSVGESE